MALKFKDKAKAVRPYTRLVLAGVGGIGKSTAAGTIAKKGLILDVNRRWPRDLVNQHDFLDVTESYSGIKEALNAVLAEPKLDNDMLIVDTMTDVLRLIRQHAINVNFSGEAEKYNAFTNGDKNYAPQYANELLNLMDRIAEKHKMNLCVICHTTPKDQKNIHGKDFFKQCLDLPERVSAAVLQWADACGHAYFDVEVKQDGLKVKARSHSRVISFNDNPGYDAKSGLSHPLPEKIPFTKDGGWADLVFGKRPLVNELEMLLEKYPEDKVDAVRTNLEKINFRALPDDQLKGLVEEMTKYVNNGFKEAK